MVLFSDTANCYVASMSLSERLGIPEEELARAGLLQLNKLPDHGDLLTAAFKIGPSDPPAAQALLAAALLSKAGNTQEGRLSAALTLLARLVAKANPARTLGPEGAEIRARVMPNGWRYTIESWPRLRYAWREGLVELLDPNARGPRIPSPQLTDKGTEQLETMGGAPAEAIIEQEERNPDIEIGSVQALDEITRLNPADPEPVSVAIREQWPNPRIGFAITVAGLGISLYSMYTAMREAEEVKRELKGRKKGRIKKRYKKN